jgi:sugar phosphate isomerase/epimerase
MIDNNIYHYIELFVIPGSTKNIKKRQQLKCKFILHAPHDEYGCNISKNTIDENTALYIKESIEFANKLDAKIIIMHSGN